MKNLKELTQQYKEAFINLMDSYLENGYLISSNGQMDIQNYNDIKEVCSMLCIDTDEIEEKYNF